MGEAIDLNKYDATELAYKNGFKDGVESATKHDVWKAMYNPLGELIGWEHNECGRVTCEASNYCPDCGVK